jgi:hypothetical protein
VLARSKIAARVFSTDDPLKMVRKWVDDIKVHWRTGYKPGSQLVVDESMIGWTGAMNIHMAYLPNITRRVPENLGRWEHPGDARPGVCRVCYTAFSKAIR